MTFDYTKAYRAAEVLLQSIESDTWMREGLAETPGRVAKAWAEWTSGYSIDIASLFKTFKDGGENYKGMVILTEIPFHSQCEHHLAPFVGTADVAYIPAGRVIGLSKIARLVDAFARRLQVQERLTDQIVDAMMEHLQPQGCIAVLRATHGCMGSRGARLHAVTTTSSVRGVFDTDPATRAEFMALSGRR